MGLGIVRSTDRVAEDLVGVGALVVSCEAGRGEHDESGEGCDGGPKDWPPAWIRATRGAILRSTRSARLHEIPKQDRVPWRTCWKYGRSRDAAHDARVTRLRHS